jgi:uncharacterized protein RhaS with RHS repeats
MTDILAQIGNKLGAEVKLLQAQIDAGGGGGSSHTHPDPTDDFTEFTFSGGVLSGSTTYTDSTKAVELSSKSFTYSNGLLSQVVESEGGAVHLTKTITYDSNGNLESITKDYA